MGMATKGTTYDVIKEVAVDKSTWKLQKVVYTDGTHGYSIRKFITLKNGYEQVTGNGFYILEDAICGEHLSALKELMIAMVGDRRENRKPTVTKKYGLIHTKTLLAYGEVGWSGSHKGGVTPRFLSIQAAKDFREEKCPEKFKANFKARTLQS
jgi:hypothetical protein